MVSVFYGFRSCSSARGARRAKGGIVPSSPQIHDRAGGARARSDSDIVMRSPAAKDPDLTSGLRGFNPGRPRFQGNCVCLFFACLLLACCLLLLVFLCFCFLLEPGGKAEKQSREAPLRVMFPLRFRHVSVTFPWCASPWPLPGASVKEASIREQS